MDEPIRLFGINAPELKGPERPKGLKSRDRLRELLNGKEIFVETIKDTKGKFGRYLGKIWIEENRKWVSVNDRMVKEGFAEYKDY
jgi:micrococcal nuclease